MKETNSKAKEVSEKVTTKNNKKVKNCKLLKDAERKKEKKIRVYLGQMDIGKAETLNDGQPMSFPADDGILNILTSFFCGIGKMIKVFDFSDFSKIEITIFHTLKRGKTFKISRQKDAKGEETAFLRTKIGISSTFCHFSGQNKVKP